MDTFKILENETKICSADHMANLKKYCKACKTIICEDCTKIHKEHFQNLADYRGYYIETAIYEMKIVLNETQILLENLNFSYENFEKNLDQMIEILLKQKERLKHEFIENFKFFEKKQNIEKQKNIMIENLDFISSDMEIESKSKVIEKLNEITKYDIKKNLNECKSVIMQFDDLKEIINKKFENKDFFKNFIFETEKELRKENYFGKNENKNEKFEKNDEKFEKNDEKINEFKKKKKNMPLVFVENDVPNKFKAQKLDFYWYYKDKGLFQPFDKVNNYILEYVYCYCPQIEKIILEIKHPKLQKSINYKINFTKMNQKNIFSTFKRSITREEVPKKLGKNNILEYEWEYFKGEEFVKYDDVNNKIIEENYKKNKNMEFEISVKTEEGNITEFVINLKKMVQISKNIEWIRRIRRVGKVIDKK